MRWLGFFFCVLWPVVASASPSVPVCVVRIPGDFTGAVYDWPSTPKSGLLLRAERGWFRYDGQRVSAVPGEATGPVFEWRDAPSGGLLLRADAGLFRYDGQRVSAISGAHTGRILRWHELKSGRLMLEAGDGLFMFDGQSVTPISETLIGTYYYWFNTVGGALIVRAKRGLFHFDGERFIPVQTNITKLVFDWREEGSGLLLRAAGGLFRFDGHDVTAVPGDTTGVVYGWAEAAGRVLLLWAQDGLFKFDGERVERLTDAGDTPGYLYSVYDAPNGVLLVHANTSLSLTKRKWFRFDGRQLELLADEHPVFVEGWQKTPQGELLLQNYRRWYKFDGQKIVEVRGTSVGKVIGWREALGGMLLLTERGLFRYDGQQLTALSTDASGSILDWQKMYGGLLLRTERGWFYHNGERMEALPGDLTGEVSGWRNAPEDGFLMRAEHGLFLSSSIPFSSTQITLLNRSELQASRPASPAIETRWQLRHPCMLLGEHLKLRVLVTNPTGQISALVAARDLQIQHGEVLFNVPIRFTEKGTWKAQVQAVIGESAVEIGRPTTLSFSWHFMEWLEETWKLIATGALVALVLANMAIFYAARYSTAALRLATDDAWGSRVLAFPMLLLRHWRPAQLWVLDLYVQKVRANLMKRPILFLSLPLRGPKGEVTDSATSSELLSVARRLWVQGSAGMGKTTVFQFLMSVHFGGKSATAFSIFRRDGYVLVPIPARRFADIGGDEKTASAWVQACIPRALAEQGFSIEDRGVLRAFLRTGTLALAIDGLNEVARNPAVLAFASEFPMVPLFVTSQETGEEPFQVWRLPQTINAHINDLLRLYLGEHFGGVLAVRLSETNLKEHLRSGYDVRLVAELAADDPQSANLPSDRVSLYREVVRAAWPEDEDRLSLLQAAAWKIISERGPNEDKRRLKSEADVPADLLNALEGVREREGRRVRLVRSAPPYFEFVHDQMNAFLAACWVVEKTPTLAAMRDLLTGSKAWQDSAETQRVLWSFVAALVDRGTLEELWIFSADDERRVVLRRALEMRAAAEGWPLTLEPTNMELIADR